MLPETALGWAMIAAGAALVVIAAVGYLALLDSREKEINARAYLARRGYRTTPAGRDLLLWSIRHEDDEGWWTGDIVGTFPTVAAAARYVARRKEKEQ